MSDGHKRSDLGLGIANGSCCERCGEEWPCSAEQQEQRIRDLREEEAKSNALIALYKLGEVSG